MNKICHDDLTFVSETPTKTGVKNLKHKGTVKKVCAAEVYKLQRNETTYFTTTKQIQINYHINNKPPYVYYDIRKILSLNVKNFPRNNKFHTVGIYVQENFNKCITEIEESSLKQTNLKLHLDFRSHNILPKIGCIIELFGYVEFQNNTLRYSIPIFVVNFWKEITGNVTWYIKNLNKKRVFIPECYTFSENISVKVSSLKLDDYFNDNDDTVLNKHVDSVEKLVNEIKELMNIDLDLFL